MWEFYLVLCQTAFEVGHLAVHHWQLFKGINPKFLSHGIICMGADINPFAPTSALIYTTLHLKIHSE